MVFRAVPFSRRPKKAGSSSYQLGSPPEFVASASARSLSLPGAFRGVWFLVAASILRVHYRRASQARLRSAHSVSHALDGLLLAGSCRSISLCCHVQDFRSGVTPPTQLHHLVGGRCPRAVGAASLSSVARRRQAASRRPQGLVPGRDPVRDREGLARARVRVPSRSSPSDSRCRPCRGGEPRLHPRPSRAPLECCARWSRRIDRPTASMLYL